LIVLLAIFILAAFISDAKRSLIPNALSVSAAAVGLVYHLAFDGWSGLLFSAIGLTVGFAMLLLLYSFGALGAGDVKLFAAVGAMMGTAFVWQSMMYSVLYAGVIGFLLLLHRKRLVPTGFRMAYWIVSIIALKDISTVKRIKEHELMQFPFMYAVLPGVMTAWYYSQV
jgi:prepilin peptidase CpaA